ncbi:EAL domain-containing protein [Yokenella regensburgei]|uniref:EAL domain-containing protein n=1 Tax=Yokenella regensburgei TaxID=158877 RepID=UPI003F15D616
MQTAQQIISGYRRKRIIVCALVAIAVFLATLAVRFILERNLNERKIATFTAHAVQTLDKLLLPLELRRSDLIPLVGQPCASAHFLLRKQAASLQTVRSVALIKDGILYCSSIFGYRDVPINQLQPALPSPTPLLLLSTDQSLLKNSPVMIFWYPTTPEGQSGIIEVINIDLLTAFTLEPDSPLISGASLSVGQRHLVYGQGVVGALPALKGEERYQKASDRFPFSVAVVSPGAARLAWRYLSSQVPLALMLSLLMGYIAWLATASRMSFSWEINLGMAAREFELFCQPLLDAGTNRCVGVEILLRWNNPRQGWISPEVFIPIAEEHHLIAPLTRYVMAETQRQIGLFPADTHFQIGINVAPSHLRNGELLKDLNTYWFSARPTQQLTIEITERDALQDVDYRMVRELHRKGLKIAIDDFGTGNSSLSWLERLRPDVLKIDKSFTTAIGTDAVNATVTDIIISLGQRLNIELVAEGVENLRQASHLRQRGVHVLQGFLYAKPMPVKEFPRWLAGWSPPPARHTKLMTPFMSL